MPTPKSIEKDSDTRVSNDPNYAVKTALLEGLGIESGPNVWQVTVIANHPQWKLVYNFGIYVSDDAGKTFKFLREIPQDKESRL